MLMLGVPAVGHALPLRSARACIVLYIIPWRRRYSDCRAQNSTDVAVYLPFAPRHVPSMPDLPYGLCGNPSFVCIYYSPCLCLFF